MDTKNIGLRNIEVADTKISYIDGQKGKLIYRGFDILDLTKNSNLRKHVIFYYMINYQLKMNMMILKRNYLIHG